MELEKINTKNKEIQAINNLIDITMQRITNVHQCCPTMSLENDKMYLNNIKAMALLFKMRKDLQEDNIKGSVSLDYESVLKKIINN
ncbi:MAG: hypothetical protein LBQ34_07035 [Alphaproteobacteria bacterium]|jgi:ribosomal protein L22|nr:hypothetical protein [Alphaproteobacteria bacterium]